MEGNWNIRTGDGESFNDIQARFIPFIESVLERVQNTPEDILMVGHGGLFKCMLPLLVENLGFEFMAKYPFSNTGYIQCSLIQADCTIRLRAFGYS